MSAPEIIQTITLAVAGWTLLEVISQGKKLAAFEQRVKDLPCDNCQPLHE